jgi:cytoskeleton protein RodZ
VLGGQRSVKKERRQITLEELGRAIKTRREELELSLQDVADLTKIRVQFLESIEEGRFEKLPGLVYARGFLRTVLRTIDADDLWEYYKPLLYDMHKQDAEADKVVGACSPPAKGFRQASRFWVIVVLILAVIGTGWYVWYSWREGGFSVDQVAQQNEEKMLGERNNVVASSDVVSQDTSPLSDGASIDVTEKSGDAASLVTTSQGEGQSSSENAEKPEKEDIESQAVSKLPVLDITSKGECWVRVRSQSGILYQGILKKGKNYTLEVKERVTVTYGRASDVLVSWKGEDLGRPGDGSRVVHIFYSSDGKTGRVSE